MRRWAVIAAIVASVVGLSVFAVRQVGDDSGQLAGRSASEGEQAILPPATPAPLAADATGSQVSEAYAGLSQEALAAAPPAAADASPASEEPVAPPLPDTAGRKIIRNATIVLQVEDVGAMVQRVDNIAAAAGGFVANSSVFIEHQEPPTPVPQGGPQQPLEEEPRRTQTATLTIRVPASEYASVLAQLRELGEVQSESASAGDVTEEFADLEARRRNLEATEQQYLRLLEQAENISEILTLQDRINSVRLEIERIQGRLNLLNNLTDLATIEVQLRPLAPPEPLEPPKDQGWDPSSVADGAWEASRAVLEGLGNAAIIGGVVLAWLAVPAVAGVIAWRLLGPRRPRGGEA